MSEVKMFLCDGPACTKQETAGQRLSDAPDWINVTDWTSSPRGHFHFCSWACLDMFSDAKVAGHV